VRMRRHPRASQSAGMAGMGACAAMLSS
jgi:hypothetical protein